MSFYKMMSSMVATLFLFLFCLSCNVPSTANAQFVNLPASYMYQSVSNAEAYSAWPAGSYSTLSLSDDGIATAGLNFTFYFYGRAFTTTSISSNGNMQFATSSTTYSPSAMPTDSSLYLPVLAAFWTDLYSSVPTSTFMYRTEGTAPNRVFVMRYYRVNFCCTSGEGPITFEVALFETTNVIEFRYYELGTTPQGVVIGMERGGGQRSDGSYDYSVYWNDVTLGSSDATALQGNTLRWTNIANMTLPPPIPLSYNVSRTTGVVTAAANLTNEIFLQATDDGVDSIPLGFNFTFYGVSYNAINVSANGDIQFETSISSITSVSMPSSTSSRAPFVAILNTNLWPQCSYCRSYGTAGFSPDRVFTLRYKNVPYFYYARYADPFTTGYTVSFDVLLFETNSTIEVRYYTVPRVSQYALAGIQGSPILRADYTYDYTAVLNNVYLTTGYTQLHGTTIRYMPAVAIPPPPISRDGVTYSIQTVAVTPRVDLTNTSITCSDDGFVTNIPIGFNFTFFDHNYSTVGMSCNGNLQFATTSTSLTPVTLPSGNTAYLPLLSFWWSDLNRNYGGSMVYGNLGTAPNREFHLRFTNIRFYGQSTTDGVTCDVVLFEQAGRFELRYHVVTYSTSNRYVLIGAESSARTSNGAYDYAAVFNRQQLTSTAAASIQGNTYVFSTVPLPYTPPPPVPLSYALIQSSGAVALELNASTALPTEDETVVRVDLGFFFYFYGRWYSSVYIGNNGEMHFADLPSTKTPTDFPQRMGGYMPVIAYFFVDLYPTRGEQRVYQTMGTSPNRMFVLRHRNSYYWYCGGNLNFDVILYENGRIEFRYFSELTACQYVGVVIGIQGNAIRRADYTYDYASVANLLPASETFLSTLRNTTYSFVPRVTVTPPTPFTPIESPLSTYAMNLEYSINPLTLNNPVPLPGGDDTVVQVSLGFNFVFYGQTYQRVYLGGNGNVQFTTQSSSWYPSAMPTGNNGMQPYIAHFFCDLYPSAGLSKVYQTTGEPGTRKFVLRYTNIPYLSNTALTNDIDLILFEEDNHIEVHYHRISAATNSILIGIQGTATSVPAAQQDYAVLNNVERLDTTGRALLLSGSTLSFRPKVDTPPVPIPRYTYVMSQTAGVPTTRPTLSSPVTLATTDDGANSYITMGFAFPFFGVTYTYCSISTNGNIQFVTNQIDPFASPLPLGDIQRVPGIFFAWTDLYPTTGAVRQYSISGTAPNRQFIVRYTDVAYRTSLAIAGSSSAPKLSVDVILNENGNIVFQYYRLDAVYAPITIGIESQLHADYSSEFYVFHNALPLNATTATAISGTTLTFQYSNTNTSYVARPDIVAVVPRPYSQGTYQVSYLRGVQPETTVTMTPITFRTTTSINMGLNFTVFGTTFTQVWLDRRGLIAFGANPANITNYNLPYSVYGITAYIPFAFTPFVTNLGGISYTTVGIAGSRTFIVRYSNQRYEDLSGYMSVDVLLYEADGKIELRYYRVDRSLAPVTIGIVGPTTNDVPNYATFLSTARISRSLAKGLYRGTIILSQTPFVQPAPTNISYIASVDTTTTLPTTAPALNNAFNLPASNDGVDRINLGFIFRFYGAEYQSIQIDANGDIQFATAISDIVPDPLPLGNMALAPFFAYFYTDLYPNYADSRQYAYSGDAYPNRVFTLRLNNVPYFATRFNTPAAAVSIDVKLFEVDGHVEVLYYRVDACDSQTVVVGIEGLPYLRSDWSSDYTVYNNINAVPASSSVVSQLVGRRLSFTPSVAIGLPRYIAPPFYTVTRSTGLPIREDMTSATQLGTGSYVLYPNIPIGFSFNFYNVSYTNVTISSNGNLQFATQLYNYYAYPMPSGQNMGPFIPFMMGYLYQTASGYRSYKTFGTAPNRYFVVRFDRHNYCCVSGLGPLSIDTVLFEADGRIEIRVHSIAVSTGSYPVLIGVQNSTSPRPDGVYDYTTVINAEMITAEQVEYLNNRTFTFSVSSRTNWTGPVPLEVSYSSQQYRDVGAVTALVNPTYLAGSDEAVDRIPIGFAFRFYNTYYKAINVGSNGELQFSTSYPSRTVQAMPLTFSTRLPLLAFFYTDLYPTGATSKSYVTTGTYPNRVLTIRFLNVPYANCRSSLVTVDVKLYEVDSHFEVIYYRIDSCSSQEVLVGVQLSATRRTDYSYDFLAPVNQARLQSEMVNTINGTRIVFSLTRPPTIQPPTITTSSVGTYSISYVPSVVPRRTLAHAQVLDTYSAPIEINIGFNFVFYGTPYSSVTMTPNGVLQFASTQYVYAPIAMPGGTSAIFPYIAFLYSYQYYYAYYTERTYATNGTPGNRTFTVRFDNVLYSYNQPGYASADLVLFESDNHIEMRYYSVDHTYQQLFLNGIQASRLDYAVAVNAQILTPELAMMLSESTIVIQGVNPIPQIEMRRVQYTVSRTASVVTRETINSAITVFFSRTDTAISSAISIGFTFPFYGLNYTHLTLSANGNIQFGTAYTGYATTPQPVQIRAAMPMIAYAFTNLVIPAGGMTYGTGGTTPNRYFILRLVDVPYYYQSPIGNVSMDCVLYENGNIEMRYYRMSATWQGMIVGLESRKYPDGNSDYTSYINNDPVDPTTAALMTGSTITFSVASNIAYVDNPVEPIVPHGYGYGTYNATLRAGTAPYVDPLPGTPTYLACCTYYGAINLNMGFIFMGRNYSSVYLDVYGRLGFHSGSYTSLSTAMPYGNSAYTPLIAFAWSSLYAWYQTNLISYNTYGTPGSRYFILRYKNVPYSISPYTYQIGISVDLYLYEADGRIEMHYYRVDPTTDTMVIGIQGTTTSNGTVDFAYIYNDGAINAATAAGIQGKTAVFQAVSGRAEAIPLPYSQPTYRVRHVTGVTTIDMSGATYLSACDDCVNSVSLPFTFQFFGVNYTTVRFSSNGNLQWATSSTQYSVSPLPDGNPYVEPLLATFMTDLYPNSAYARSYKTFGTSPNRYFVLSVNQSGYCCSIGGTAAMVSYDTILYESTNAIEIRYYRIDVTSRYILIGVDDSRELSNGEPDYAVLVNSALLTTTLANSLKNSTVFFEIAPLPVFSSSSTGMASISSSSSPVTPVVSSSSSLIAPVVSSSSSLIASAVSSSSSASVPSVSSSSSSGGSSELPAVCNTPSQINQIALQTIELVFNVPYDTLPMYPNFMSELLSAIKNAISNQIGVRVDDQIKCGILRSATLPVSNVFMGSSSQFVATIYVQNITAGTDPQNIRTRLISMITSSSNPINDRLAILHYPQVSTSYDIYKTCTKNKVVQIISVDQLCDGETGSTSGGSSGLGSGAIAGIVIGVIVGVALLLVVLCVVLRNRGGKALGGSTRFHDEVGEDSTNEMSHDTDPEHSIAHTDDDGVELATHRQNSENNADFADEDGENETQESEELV